MMYHPLSVRGSTFTCNVRADLIPMMMATMSYKFCLTVAPTILPGLSVLGSAPGKPLTLECIVESYPEAFVVWTFGGDREAGDTRLERSYLSYFSGKIIHDKEEGYSLVKLAHSMYRLSSKLTLTNYNENKKGIYT